MSQKPEKPVPWNCLLPEWQLEIQDQLHWRQETHAALFWYWSEVFGNWQGWLPGQRFS